MQSDRSFSATRVLYDIAHALDSGEEPDTRVGSVVEWLRLIVPYESCALLVALPGRDQQFFESPQSSEAEPVELREVLVGVLSLLSEQRPSEGQSLAMDRAFGYASHLAVPLVGFDHHFGLLFVGSTLPDAYTEEHLKLLSVVASQVAAYFSKLHLVEILTARSLELEAANQSKDEFLATLSHELRSPLTAIVGWTKLLRAGRLDEAATAHALEVIDRNAKHQAKLIEDTLDMSRIITGKLRLDFQPVDLSRVIGAALESVRLTAEAKEIRITVLSQSTGLVLGDSSRLQQMVQNLLTNALNFTHRGGRVEVRLDREGSRVRLHVVDNGVGIRLNFLPHIFEPFRQADGSISRKHGGLGLGLALVRHLAELHQGKVWAESAGEGRGATFTVDLPVLAARDEEFAVITGSKIHETQGDIVPSSAGFKGRSILIVDDDIDSLEMVTEILRQSGADVLTATSAGEAYELVQRERPDVLVADLGMPEEDGYALLRKVRELAPECGGSIPAVALTGYASEEDRRQATLAGFQSHLSKPVEPTQLLTIVANLIQSDRQGVRRGKGC
jgi:signal transduction histidine kinase/ActR/RegA family two-component response regulator